MVSKWCFWAYAEKTCVTPGSNPQPRIAVKPAFAKRSRYAHCHAYSKCAVSGGS